MKAFILAAGFGKRMLPLTEVLPKSLLPIGRTPIIKLIIDRLYSYGIKDIVINLHYLADMIIEELSSISDVKICFSEESSILGTAGAIKAARNHLGEDDFIVVNSDIIADVNFTEALSFHKNKNALCTMVLRRDINAIQYGIVAIDSNYMVKGFPGMQRIAGLSEYMFTGVQIMNPAFIEEINDGYCDISKEVYPRLIKKGANIFGYIFDGYWTDIGDPLRYIDANKHYFNNIISDSYKIDQSGYRLIPSCFVDSSAYIDDTAQIGPDCSLGRGCSVGYESAIENSIVLEGASIGQKSRVIQSIIGQFTSIPSGTTIVNNIVVSIDNRLKYRKFY